MAKHEQHNISEHSLIFWQMWQNSNELHEKIDATPCVYAKYQATASSQLA